MENFVTSEQFYAILCLKIILGIFFIYLMYGFAKRTPTDFDTPYRKRMRMVYGILFSVFAIGFLVLAFTGPLASARPWYNYATYGTFTPSELELQYGFSEHMIVRPIDAVCIWGRQTFEQSAMGNNIAIAIVCVALAVYFFAKKRSSVKWFAKARKFIGYVLLLNSYTLVNTLHYFDSYEIIPIAVYALIVYLLVREYKLDAKPVTKPQESELYANVQEFEAISPEEKLHTETAIPEIEEKPKKEEGSSNSIFKKKFFFGLLLGLIAVFLIALNIAFVYRIDETPRVKDYWLFREYHVWIKNYYDIGEYKWTERPCKVDYSLGQPINGENALYIEKIDSSIIVALNGEEGNDPLCYDSYLVHEIITYDISELGYGPYDSSDYLIYVMQKHNGTPVYDGMFGCKLNGIKYNESHSINPVYILTKDRYLLPYDEIEIVHFVSCKDQYAYEIRAYHFKQGISKKIIWSLYFSNPFTIDSWLMGGAFILFGIILIYLLLLIIQKDNKVQNSPANKLFWYITSFAALQAIVACWIILITCDQREYDDEYCLATIYLTATSIVSILLALYVNWKSKQAYSSDYLLPEWYKNRFITPYRNQETWTKISLVLLFYPLFYIATLPCGILAFIYLIPMAAIFGLIFFIRWLFKDYTPSVSLPESKPKKAPQPVSTDNSSKAKLQLLKSMLDEGLITQEDYDKKKNEVLKDL